MIENTVIRPFKATVGSTMLDISPEFFNGTLSSILHELIQNARRSGATSVWIDTDVETGVTTVNDDGPGCLPADLMVFKGSFWANEAVQEEAPAGIGFWSLAKSGCHVMCGQGWEVVLATAHFRGNELIRPKEHPVIPGLGLSVSFSHAPGQKIRPSEFRYYRLQSLTINGVSVELIPFIAENSRTVRKCGEGLLVEVNLAEKEAGQSLHVDFAMKHEDELLDRHSVYVHVNYHGKVVTFEEQLTKSQFVYLFSTDNNKVGCATLQDVRVDVMQDKYLPATKPQRDSVIDGPERAELIRFVAAALREEMVKKYDYRLSVTQGGKFAGLIIDRPGTIGFYDGMGFSASYRTVSLNDLDELQGEEIVLPEPCLIPDQGSFTQALLFDAMVSAGLRFFLLDPNVDAPSNFVTPTAVELIVNGKTTLIGLPDQYESGVTGGKFSPGNSSTIALAMIFPSGERRMIEMHHFMPVYTYQLLTSGSFDGKTMREDEAAPFFVTAGVDWMRLEYDYRNMAERLCNSVFFRDADEPSPERLVEYLHRMIRSAKSPDDALRDTLITFVRRALGTLPDSIWRPDMSKVTITASADGNVIVDLG